MAGSYGTSSGTLTEGLCLNLTIANQEAFGANNPENKMEHIGVLNGILENNTGVQRYVDTGDGLRNEATTASKRVRVVFNPRYNRNGAKTTLTNGCPTGDTPAKCEFFLSANKPIESEIITMNEWEFRRYCEGPVAYRENRLMALANQVIEKLNYEVAKDLVSLVGTYKGGATTNSYNILNSDGSQRFSGGTGLRKDLTEALLSGPANIIGWGKWYEYFANAAAGGLADTGQLMNLSVQNMNWYEDPIVADASVFNDEDSAFIIGQDSVAMHTWNGFMGEMERINSREIRTTFVHGPTGIRLDLYGNYVDCDSGANPYESGNWTFRYMIHYDVATMPANIWKASDPHYGINYLFKATGTQAP